ncbi:hypothetical protein BGE01nite_51350 [Brevifollis gellanilyticus]|uniref:Uncharacterized protein n=1 Tax=Brevifollis gellanilyticus TaxID=748831 RepID=A0A512MGI9_9BACT|nr:hypothetical protein BGE01nite_51350 [Brevifollis gellanilyticus]
MSRPYFMVHSVEMKDGLAIVDGRLGEHMIAVGDVFDRAFPNSDAWRLRVTSQPCALMVVAIEAYRHSLEELHPGMTARLRLTGSHLSVVKLAEILEIDKTRDLNHS